MEKRFRYLVVKGDSPVGEEHALLHNAVLAAASHDGHAARFVRDKHGFMSFFASRRPMPSSLEYVPAPCDAFRPWSPLKNDDEALEHVSKLIIEDGRLHATHEDITVVTLTYVNNRLETLSPNAPAALMTRMEKTGNPL